MEIIIGLLIIAVGAFCQSSCYVPINKIKDWSWESYWIVQRPQLHGNLQRSVVQHLDDGVLRSALGRGRTHLRPLDEVPGCGARTVDSIGHLCRTGHHHGACAAQPLLPPAPCTGVAHLCRHPGRGGHAHRHRHHRRGWQHEGRFALRGGEEGGGEGLQLPQGTGHCLAGRLYERLLQRGPGVWQGH